MLRELVTWQDANSAWWNFRHKLQPWLWAGAGRVLAPCPLCGIINTNLLSPCCWLKSLLLLHYSHCSGWRSLLGSPPPALLHSCALIHLFRSARAPWASLSLFWWPRLKIALFRMYFHEPCRFRSVELAELLLKQLCFHLQGRRI